MLKNEERISGIEILKIIAIMLIVVSHTTQTLSQVNETIAFEDCVFKMGCASKNIQIIFLNVIYQFGSLGNTIFFVCSAFFLVGKTKNKKNKAFNLICTVWTISIIFLVFFICLSPFEISVNNIIKSLFPTLFNNNWYITCYIIFLFIYPLLNKIIFTLSQNEHLKIVVFSLFLWVISDYFKSDLFFPSNLILWCTIYFLVAYLKIYNNELMNNLKTGYILLFVGILGVIGQVVVTNYVGLYVLNSFADKVLHWNNDCCPFYLMIAIGGIIISMQSKISSHFVNYISGLSLFVYLIHENILIRTYVRPKIWHWIFLNYGYSKMLMWDFLLSLLIFIFSILISAIYKETVQKKVIFASDFIYGFLEKFYKRIEKIIIR